MEVLIVNHDDPFHQVAKPVEDSPESQNQIYSPHLEMLVSCFSGKNLVNYLHGEMSVRELRERKYLVKKIGTK